MAARRRGRKPRVVVAGAGIAGMTAALYLLEAGFHVRVLERAGHVGGKFGAVPGRRGAVHEHAYHFLGDWCVNFWTVADKLGIHRDSHFRPAPGVKFLRRSETGGSLASRLTTLRLQRLPTEFAKTLYSGVIPPDDMMIWFYSLLAIMAHGRDLDEKEFLNRISVNGFMRSLPYMTDRAALLHQEALMKAFAIPSYETSARSYRRFARFFGHNQGGWILATPTTQVFWPRFEAAVGRFRPIEYATSLEEIHVVPAGPERYAVALIRVKRPDGTLECWKDVDYLVVAVPREELASILVRSPALRRAAPRLLEVQKLRSKQMASLDLYFRRPLAGIPAEHVTLIDDRPFATDEGPARKATLASYGNRMASRFALSFVDNYQIWHPGRRKETWLNVVSADFEELEGLGEAQARRAILRELGKYVDFDRADVDRERTSLQLNAEARLFINTVGSWQYRPRAGLYADSEVSFENLCLAGDYCQSAVDLVCLEGAVLTARMAARAIADDAGRPEAVPEPEEPAEVSDARLEQQMHELAPWLDLARRRGFGARQRLAALPALL